MEDVMLLPTLLELYLKPQSHKMCSPDLIFSSFAEKPEKVHTLARQTLMKTLQIFIEKRNSLFTAFSHKQA